MRKEINPFTNPLVYNLSRQEETNRLIAHLKVFIPKEKIRKRAISYIEKHRNKIIYPDPYGFDVVKTDTGNKEIDLLAKLIERSPIYQESILNQKRYLDYCRKLFSIAGFYSLEDEYVRFFFYTALNNKSIFLDRKTRINFKNAISMVSTNPELKKNKKPISKYRKEREGERKKYLCFLLVKNLKFSVRELARLIKVDKKTIRNCVEEVTSWPANKQEVVSNEIRSHKYSPNIDVLHLSKHFKIPFSKLEYGLTEKGVYNTGQKLKHKTPDDPTEETRKLAILHRKKIISL